jgi:lysophospholipase L1-like esterase
VNPRSGPKDAAHLDFELPLPADPRLPSLFLIGDSTAMTRRPGGEKDEEGWGAFLGTSFDSSRLNVVNRALGGLSSRSYLSYGYWESTRCLMKAGDFLLIQFGHNDEGPINDDFRARGSIPGTGEESEEIENKVCGGERETVRSYGWYLRRFVSDARSLGVEAIVLSPVPRKDWIEARNAPRIARSPYADWAKTAALDAGASFVDVHAAIARRYEELGAEAVEALFSDERTHSTVSGAELNASIVASALDSLEGGAARRLRSFRAG